MADKLSLDRIDEILRAIFRELKEMGGAAKPKVVLAAAEPKLNLTDYERETTKTGAVRWSTHVRFYTTDCVKAGFLVKGDGQWTLTEKGEKALKLPAGQLIRTAQKEYRAWKKKAGRWGRPGGRRGRGRAVKPSMSRPKKTPARKSTSISTASEHTTFKTLRPNCCERWGYLHRPCGPTGR